MGRFTCGSCGCEYDEEEGDRSQGVLPNTPIQESNEWLCPDCGPPQFTVDERDE